LETCLGSKDFTEKPSKIRAFCSLCASANFGPFRPASVPFQGTKRHQKAPMKITKVLKHGFVRWRVNDASGTDGKRHRKFFETKEAAEQFVKDRTADAKAFGTLFATLPNKERATVMFQLQRLDALGWTLPAAVDFVEKHGKQAVVPDVDLSTVADQFFAAKAAAGLRPRYLKTLRASINRFLLGRRDKSISAITPAEIQEYIASNGWLPATMRSYLVDVRTLFAFAVKRKYLSENTALAVDLPRTEDKPPGIVTPTQARAILDASIDHAPDILPVIVLSLFGGLRRSEAEQMEWEEIGNEFVEVKAHKAKTRQRRLIPISPQLRAWLDTARAIDGKLPSLNYADKLKLVLEKAKLRAEWPQNALRHSFASYYFAKHKNENETAALMGNSPQMVFQHYRELVRPADANAFFAIMPPADAVKRAMVARQRRPRVMPPRESKITAESIAAIFDAGRLALSRKEAVAALAARAECSVSAAYNALSLEGRFAPHLQQENDKITWRKEAVATEAPQPANA
jgi:integrase